MARPRTLPDAEELHRLRVVEGRTYKEIAERYGVTTTAVGMALKKSHLTAPRPRYQEEIPWLVAAEHSAAYPLWMLRLAARVKNGKEVSPAKRRYVENWLENLSKPRPGAPNGVVIDYDRDYYPNGFAYVPREAEDGEWPIRRPDPEELQERRPRRLRAVGPNTTAKSIALLAMASSFL